jgi:hypothetical protein
MPYEGIVSSMEEEEQNAAEEKPGNNMKEVSVRE